MANAKRSLTTKYNDENEIMTTLADFLKEIPAKVNRIEVVISNNGEKKLKVGGRKEKTVANR